MLLCILNIKLIHNLLIKCFIMHNMVRQQLNQYITEWLHWDLRVSTAAQ